METRTAGIVAKELKELGFEVITGIGKTGVVGIMKNGEGPTVMYRADMDALPLEEKTGLPYASKVEVEDLEGKVVPVAHMCGHDSHTTWMLGVARVMAGMKDKWSGTLIMLAQPAEEVIMGAETMVKEGLYTKHGVPVPDYLLGMHSAPGPVGMVVSAPGVRMAGTDVLDVTFHGVGGHGSRPHEAKDPVLMGAMAVAQYQAIISRVIDPMETGVLTVGSFQAGNTNNVIPDEALLMLNLRFFNEAVHEKMLKAINNVNMGIARAYNLPEDKLPTTKMKGSSPPLVNDEELIKRLNEVLAHFVDKKLLLPEFPAVTGSEDFHLLQGDYGDQVEIAFLLVGIANPAVYAEALKQGKQFPFAAHNPGYTVDLASIPFGAKVGALSVLALMAK